MSEERASPEELQAAGNPWFYVIEDRTHFARSFCHGARVLDAPCGVGWTSAILAEAAEHVTGIDYDSGAIQIANSERGGENRQFETGNCLDIHLPESSFDVVVSIEAIEHFTGPDGEKYIQQLAKVLKRGGTLVGTTPSAADAASSEHRRIVEENPHHLKIYWESELRKLFAPHFDQIWIQDMPFDCFYFVCRKKLGLAETLRRTCPAWVRPLLTRGRGIIRSVTGK